MHLVDVTSGDVDLLARDATMARWLDEDSVALFAGERSPSRLSEAALVDDELVVERSLGDIQEHVYPYLGLDVAPCTG